MRKDIFIDDSGLEKIVEQLSDVPRRVPGATSRAINRTVGHAATSIDRNTRAIYNVKQKKIKGQLRKKFSNVSDLRGFILLRGYPQELTNFKKVEKEKNNQNNDNTETNNKNKNKNKGKKEKIKPIKVKIKKSGGYKTLDTNPSSFLYKGHIFKRESKKRIPIEKLYTLSIPSMASEKTVIDKTIKDINEMLEKRINVEINAVLKGINK